MIIQDSSIQFFSQHRSLEVSQSKESIRYWKTADDTPQTTDNTKNYEKNITNVSLSQEAVDVSLSRKTQDIANTTVLTEDEDREVMTNLNMRILRDLIERITGKKLILGHFKGREHAEPVAAGDHHKNGAVIEENNQGFGLEYIRQQSHYEFESSSFSAQGTIVTNDGESIEFEIDLQMEREFYQEENIEIRIGEALRDPLVVNFDGTAAQLTSTKFAFDIDADGVSEDISFVGPGSGFLALDRNADGVVNDGSELFGSMTGDGIAELKQYDDDGNSWIDEGDSVFQRLQIWTKDESGEDVLFALGSKGVGAIYLEAIETPFSIKAEQELLGQVKTTGMYLKEDHTPGIIQQLDLVV